MNQQDLVTILLTMQDQMLDATLPDQAEYPNNLEVSYEPLTTYGYDTLGVAALVSMLQNDLLAINKDPDNSTLARVEAINVCNVIKQKYPNLCVKAKCLEVET
jgi:hypothetical protein